MNGDYYCKVHGSTYPVCGKCHDEVRAHQRKQAKRIIDLEAEVEQLLQRLKAADRAVDAVQNLINDSHGVVGLHLNGDQAPWDELLEGEFCEWLEDFAAYREGRDDE